MHRTMMWSSHPEVARCCRLAWKIPTGCGLLEATWVKAQRRRSVFQSQCTTQSIELQWQLRVMSHKNYESDNIVAWLKCMLWTWYTVSLLKLPVEQEGGCAEHGWSFGVCYIFKSRIILELDYLQRMIWCDNWNQRWCWCVRKQKSKLQSTE